MNVRLQRLLAAGQRGRLFATLLVIMPFVALLPRYLLIERMAEGSQSIVQVGFGFGGFVESLLSSGEFRSCAPAPFPTCGEHQCQYATRMPAMPLLYAGLAKSVGEQSAAVAFAKCVLMALMLAGLLAVLVGDMRPSALGVVLLYAIYLGPQALKHGSAITYEEGMLLDLELGLAVALAYFLRPALATSEMRQTLMGCVALAIAVLMYFTKTTTLLILLVVLGILLSSERLGARMKAAALAFSVIPFLAWGAHVFATTGALHFSSSWNGENLFRGFNSASLAIYPQVSLDRTFDSERAVLEDGRSVALGSLAGPACFADEWAWDKFNTQRSLRWAETHPLDVLRFLGKKIEVAFFELRHTPYHVSATEKDQEYPRPVTIAMAGWMGFARLLFFALVARLVVDLRGPRRREALWTLALLAAAFAPYVAVFAYERHLVPLLVMAAGLLVTQYFVQPRTATP